MKSVMNWFWPLLLWSAGIPAEDLRVALVIGNSAYQHTSELSNPGNDATDVAAALAEVGFVVEGPLLNASKAEMEAALASFAGTAARAKQAIVFFAGHGVEANGENYLLPIEAKLLSERTVSLEAVKLSDVMAVVSAASELGVVVLDACRNNPLAAQMSRVDPKRSGYRGLAPVEPGGNLLVAYAAEAGSLASDGAGRNSPFTRAWLAALRGDPMEVRLLWGNVRDAVMAATGGEQRPFTYGTLGGRALYLGRPASAAQLTASTPGSSTIVNELDQARVLIKEHKYSLAVAPLERAVARGDVEAMWTLAELLGKPGIDDEPKRWKQLVSDAAAQGQPDALLTIAFSQAVPNEPGDTDDMFPQDREAARSQFRKLAQRSDHWATLAKVLSDILLGDSSGSTEKTLFDPEAKKALEASATAGNEIAAELLLLAYFDAPFDAPEAQQNLERGLYWASRLSDLDNEEGQYRLGICLFFGECGVAVDRERGWSLLQQSAAQGDVQANLAVGTVLRGENTFGIPPNVALAKRHLSLAADDGDANAMLQLASIALNDDEMATARLWLQKSSDAGLPEAMNLHALALIEERYGFEKNVKSGTELLQRAAEAGHDAAQNNLGEYHYFGENGMAKDHGKARRYFELAAAQGNPSAQSNLAYMHLNGEGGLAKDSAKAAELFRQSADAGNASAQVEYAYHLAYKASDPVQARRYFDLAVAQGNSAALRGLAELYLDGMGVVPDRGRAMELLQAAARQGDQPAKELLDSLQRSSGRGE